MKIRLLLIIIIGILISLAVSHHDWHYRKVNMPLLDGYQILMIVAHEGFNPAEYRIPQKLFERSGAQVIIASTRTTNLISERWPIWSLSRIKMNADIVIEDVEVSDYDAIVFVGGGEDKLINHPIAHAIAKEAIATGKVLGAICKAPLILAEAGVLDGKKATVWHPFGIVNKHFNALEQAGAEAIKEDLVIDGRVITANRPTHASLFAEQIAWLLKNNDKR